MTAPRSSRLFVLAALLVPAGHAQVVVEGTVADGRFGLTVPGLAVRSLRLLAGAGTLDAPLGLLTVEGVPLGWLVGWVERPSGDVVFAMNVEASGPDSGWEMGPG